jgi:hypothetical protein
MRRITAGLSLEELKKLSKDSIKEPVPEHAQFETHYLKHISNTLATH